MVQDIRAFKHSRFSRAQPYVAGSPASSTFIARPPARLRATILSSSLTLIDEQASPLDRLLVGSAPLMLSFQRGRGPGHLTLAHVHQAPRRCMKPMPVYWGGVSWETRPARLGANASAYPRCWTPSPLALERARSSAYLPPVAIGFRIERQLTVDRRLIETFALFASHATLL